jgi:hypothetical protein
MKTFLRILLVLALVSGIPRSGFGWVDDQGVLLAVKTSDKPVIDGQLDDVWKMVGKERMTNYDLAAGQAPADWLDLFGTVRVAWDDANLYTFVEIYDETLSKDADNADNYQFDSVELYFDADNNKTEGAYDGVDDFQMVFSLGQTTLDDVDLGYGNGIPGWGFSKTGVEYAAFETTIGWNLETQIPLSNLKIASTPDKVFGFDVQIDDNDGGATRQHLLRWWATDDAEWKDASIFGTAKLYNDYVVSGYALPVGKANFTPVIDGEFDPDWDLVPEVTENVFSVGTASLKSDWNDGTVNFRLMWDDQKLYIFAKVWDDLIQNVGDYQADGIEYYFDGDNAKTQGSYDGLDDMQLRIKHVAATMDEINPGGIVPPSLFLKEDVEFVNMETDYGWAQEIAIPLADLNISPEAAAEFGFDVQLNESDVENTRETASKWWSNSDNSWMDASLFGTAVLSEASVGGSGIADQRSAARPRSLSLSQNYPNPFNPTTRIDYSVPARGKVRLEVFNLQGRLVSTLVDEVKSPGQYTADLDGGGLKSGIYVCRIEMGSKIHTKKMTLIK